MEVVTNKPFKSSSNISEIVSKFAKVCKFRSIGVFPSENPLNGLSPGNDNGAVVEDHSDATDETECDAEKIHPQHVEAPRKTNVCGDTEIAMLFDIVSALKTAYVKLQEAHLPHNPKMLVAADKLFMAELEALCKVKRAYKEKRLMKAESSSSRFALMQAKIEANEKLLEGLKSKVKAKNSEVIKLVHELKELDVSNVKLGKKIKQISLERKFATVFNVTSFQNAFTATSKSIHDFAKPLISLMKASGWDLDRAAKAIEGEAVYSKRSHKKYTFEAYIARRMFSCFSLEKFDVNYVMRFDDPIDALIEDPDLDFAKFCGKKYLLVVHPTMEASFFGNLDHRALVLSGKHPRTPFYQIFARMAKWVWVLQGIAGSLDPKAKVFTVSRRSAFSDVYMESVEDDKEGAVFTAEGQLQQTVEFMVMPGFKIGEALVKSRVYLSRNK